MTWAITEGGDSILISEGTRLGVAPRSVLIYPPAGGRPYVFCVYPSDADPEEHTGWRERIASRIRDAVTEGKPEVRARVLMAEEFDFEEFIP